MSSSLFWKEDHRPYRCIQSIYFCRNKAISLGRQIKKSRCMTFGSTVNTLFRHNKYQIGLGNSDGISTDTPSKDYSGINNQVAFWPFMGNECFFLRKCANADVTQPKWRALSNWTPPANVLASTDLTLLLYKQINKKFTTLKLFFKEITAFFKRSKLHYLDFSL